MSKVKDHIIKKCIKIFFCDTIRWSTTWIAIKCVSVICEIHYIDLILVLILNFKYLPLLDNYKIKQKQCLSDCELE